MELLWKWEKLSLRLGDLYSCWSVFMWCSYFGSGRDLPLVVPRFSWPSFLSIKLTCLLLHFLDYHRFLFFQSIRVGFLSWNVKPGAHQRRLCRHILLLLFFLAGGGVLILITFQSPSLSAILFEANMYFMLFSFLWIINSQWSHVHFSTCIFGGFLGIFLFCVCVFFFQDTLQIHVLLPHTINMHASFLIL